MCRDGSTGSEVSRALTSNDVITSPGSSFLFWICRKNVCFYSGGETGQPMVWWCKPVLLPHYMLWTPYWTLWGWGGANFMDFRKAINFRVLHKWGTVSCIFCCWVLPIVLCPWVHVWACFDFGSGVLVKDPVCVGVIQKYQCFVAVFWCIHDNYCHPLSAVSTTLDVSSLSWVKVLHSSMMRLGLMCVPWFLRIFC